MRRQSTGAGHLYRSGPSRRHVRCVDSSLTALGPAVSIVAFAQPLSSNVLTRFSGVLPRRASGGRNARPKLIVRTPALLAFAR